MDNIVIQTLALSIAAVATLFFVSKSATARWEQKINESRHVSSTFTMPNWNKLFTLASGAGIVFALGFTFLASNPFIAASMSALVWITVIIARLIYGTMLIPKEPVQTTYFIGLALAAAYILTSQAYTSLIYIGIWLVLSIIPFIPKSIGMGVVRVWLASGLLVVWWLGPFLTIGAVILAVIIGIIIKLITSTKNVRVIQQAAKGPEIFNVSTPESAQELLKNNQVRVFPFGLEILIAMIIVPTVAILLAM